MRERKLEILAQRQPWRDTIELLIQEVIDPNRDIRAVGINIVMEELHPHTCPKAPTLRIGYQEAQQLMDDLWRAGLRPTEGAGSAGSLRATEKHLADMRRIAFNQLGIPQELGK